MMRIKTEILSGAKTGIKISDVQYDKAVCAVSLL